jgi:predicted phosphodiesterase
LNSCAYHGGEEVEKDRGAVPPSTVERLAKEIASLEPKCVSVLLCHHHPHQHQELGLGAEDVMRNGQVLLDMLGEDAAARWIVVHGHKHHPKVSYASGGATSPVVFSAGSLSANLYLELQTEARNQFYILEFDVEAVLRSGLVGIVRAWNWFAGAGWKIARGEGGIASGSGFGCRLDPRMVAKMISETATTSPIKWSRLAESLTDLSYVLPSDLDKINKSLGPHGLALSVRDGLADEIGRPPI